MIEEVWQNIINYVGLYMVSNYGRIKSLRFNKERILKPFKDKKGYLYFDLCKNCKIKRFMAHRLVLETFIGLCPKGMEACHNDGNSGNNFAGNLRWDTHKNNVKDSVKHGTFYRGDKRGVGNGRAKMNNEKIIEIRKLAEKDDLTQKQIAIMFNMSAYAIWAIINHKTWKHVK